MLGQPPCLMLRAGGPLPAMFGDVAPSPSTTWSLRWAQPAAKSHIVGDDANTRAPAGELEASPSHIESVIGFIPSCSVGSTRTTASIVGQRAW